MGHRKGLPEASNFLKSPLRTSDSAGARPLLASDSLTFQRGDPLTFPLDGITVVSLEHAIAAPFCTRQLADLGARVIKVERPGSGDFARA